MRQTLAFLLGAALPIAALACTPDRNFGTGGEGTGASTTTSSDTTTTTTSSDTTTTSSSTTTSSTSTTSGPACTDDNGCDDGDACTTDACDQGACVNTPVNADDGDACTTDACDKVAGVTHTPIDVDDGDPCTVDACDKIAGPTHDPVDADDGDACTDDACDKIAGITHTPVAVDDGDVCTVDACDKIAGVTHTPLLDLSKLHITEVNIGNPDYLVITNTAMCPNSIAGLRVVFDVSTGADVTTMLPAQMIPPGGSVEITDMANPPATKIPSGAPIAFDPTLGGAAMLCNGACTSTTVLDAVAFHGGAAAPPLPTGVTFAPQPLRGITTKNQQRSSFRRVAYSGAPPSFLRSDWAVGRPCDIRNLEIVELNIGSSDFVVIHNPTICKLPLGGLQVFNDDSSAGDTTAMLPAQAIAPGEFIKLVQSGPVGNDISIGSIPYSPTRGGCTFLCEGVCTNAANIIDAVCFDGTAVHPPLPAGATFNATGVTGINTANQSTSSFVRLAENGVAPNFLKNDWGVAPVCTSQTHLTFGELNVGVNDYGRIENQGNCAIDLLGTQVLFDDSASGDLVTVLPSFLLAAGSGVYLKEAAALMSGDINAGANIPYSATRGGSMVLCMGACDLTNGANVIDLVAFSTGAPFPPLPTGITFSSGLVGIDQATETTKSFLRGGYAGGNPKFFASDWFVGPATQ